MVSLSKIICCIFLFICMCLSCLNLWAPLIQFIIAKWVGGKKEKCKVTSYYKTMDCNPVHTYTEVSVLGIQLGLPPERVA